MRNDQTEHAEFDRQRVEHQQQRETQHQEHQLDVVERGEQAPPGKVELPEQERDHHDEQRVDDEGECSARR